MANFAPAGIIYVGQNFRGFMNQLGIANKGIQNLGTAGTRASIGMGAVGLAAGAAVLAVGALGGAATKTAASYEEAFTAVLKTTDDLSDELGNLTEMGEEVKQGLKEMSEEVSHSFEDLSGIAAVAGQIGVADEALVGFTKTVADLAVSTDLGTRDAAFALARFQAVMGTSEEDVDNLASAIVHLGNTFPTTEAEIARFLPRVVGWANVVGLAEQDVLGLAASVASLGWRAEAGSTAMQRVFLEMQKAVATQGEKLELFAATARLSMDEFSDAFREKPVEAFTAFLAGIRDLDEVGTTVLDELGLGTARYAGAILALAESQDKILIPAIKDANKAWDENTALTREANLFYGTLNGEITQTKNALRNMMETAGMPLAEMLKEWVINLRPFINQLGRDLPGVMNKTVIPSLLWISKAVSDLRDALAPMAEALWKSFQETLIPALNDTKEALAPIVEDSLVWIKDNGPAVAESIELIGLALATAFVYSKVTAAVTGLVTGLTALAGIIGVTGTISTGAAGAGGAAGVAGGAALIPGVNLLVGALAILAGSVLAVEYNVGGVRDKMVEMWETMTGGQEIATTLEGRLKQLAEFGIKQSLIGALNAVEDKWSGFWNNILYSADSKTKALEYKLRGAGHDSIEAFASSIKETAPTAVGAIDTMAQSIANMFTASPTGVPADRSSPLNSPYKWGGYVSEGVALGITKKSVNVKKAIDSMVDSVVGSFELLGIDLPAIAEDAVTLVEDTFNASIGPIAGQMYQVGKQSLENLVAGMAQAYPQLVNIAKIIQTLLVGAFSPLASIFGIKMDVPDLSAIWNQYGGHIGGEIFYGPGEETKYGFSGKWEYKKFLREQEEFKKRIEELLYGDDDDDAGGKAPKPEDPIEEALEDIETALEKWLKKMGKLFDLGSAFASLGSAAADIMKRDFFDPIDEEISDMEDRMEDPQKWYDDLSKQILAIQKEFGPGVDDALRGYFFGDSGDPRIRELVRLMELRNNIWGEILSKKKIIGELEEEYRKEQERILALEEKRQQLAFLEEQLQFLETIREYGLDAADVLGGLVLGLDADIPLLIERMVEMMTKIISEVEDELVAGTTPDTPLVTAGAVMAGAGAQYNQSNTFNTTIASDMDMAVFEQRVLRVVRSDLQ